MAFFFLFLFFVGFLFFASCYNLKDKIDLKET